MRFIYTSHFFWVVIFFIPIEFSFAQNNPADLFDENCADCHSIGEGDMKGPDLMGVEQRRSEEWLIKFTKFSKGMIEEGEIEAVKVWEKYKKAKMPKIDLSDEEIKSIFAYIKSKNKNVAPVKQTSATTPKKQEGIAPKEPGTLN